MTGASLRVLVSGASLTGRSSTTATTSSETTASTAEASSEAPHSSAAEKAHELGEEGTWVTPTSSEATATAHSSDVLALGLNSELSSTEQRLV
jgi:hypothetical protein